MKIQLGSSELMVSRICFGGEQLGGHGYGTYDVKSTIDAANIAFEKGINFFDTADCYGLGQSEINLGSIIQGRRSEFVVSSKFGVRFENGKVGYDNSSAFLNQALEGSLKRLGTDYIDLYQVHHHDKHTPLEDIFSELEKHAESGKIRYYGVSNINLESIPLDQFPHLATFSQEYSLANRDKESEIEALIAKKLGFIAFGTLGQGILTGKYNENSVFQENDRRSRKAYVNFHEGKLKNNLRIVERMKSLNLPDVPSPSQIAMNWVLSRLSTSVIIAGVKNEKQFLDAYNASVWEMNNQDILFLDEVSDTKKLK